MATSEQLKAEADLEAAIHEYLVAFNIAPESGSVLTGWFIQAVSSGYDSDGDACDTYSRAQPEGQPLHVTLGLIEYARHALGRSAAPHDD